MLALQEGAAGGAGQAAALAEAEAAALREGNGALQRELKETHATLAGLRTRLDTAERARDDAQAARADDEKDNAALAAKLREARADAERAQESSASASREWAIERSRLEGAVASEARERESAEAELRALRERLTKVHTLLVTELCFAALPTTERERTNLKLSSSQCALSHSRSSDNGRAMCVCSVFRVAAQLEKSQLMERDERRAAARYPALHFSPQTHAHRQMDRQMDRFTQSHEHVVHTVAVGW